MRHVAQVFFPSPAAARTHETMIKCIGDPLPKRRWCEKAVGLTQTVELWVSVEHSGRNELVKDADDEWRKHGEDDVVE